MTHVPRTTHVIYTEINPGKPDTKRQGACFSGMCGGYGWNGGNGWKTPHTIRYEAKYIELTDDEVKAWIRFVYDLFDNDTTGLLTHEFVGLKDKFNWVTYTLKTDGMHLNRALVQLSLCRYIDEIWEVVRAVVSSPDQSLQGRLDTFVRAHSERKVSGGHILLYGARPGLTVELFRQRLKIAQTTSGNHFAPAPVPSKPVVQVAQPVVQPAPARPVVIAPVVAPPQVVKVSQPAPVVRPSKARRLRLREARAQIRS